nr:FAD-dependent oxidoreductase [Candidatus Eremiobacteraeota bacterium]
MIKHDVVVIGGGLAGMRAAVEAAERGADVAIVSKMHPVRSHSGAAQGGINAALGNREEDSPEAHAFDTAKGSDYLGDQDAIEAMCEDAPRQIIWLEHRGCIFSRLPDGRIAQRPFGGAGTPRTCYSADVTGLVILHTLWEQLERFNVKVYEEYFCTALCIEDGVGSGIVAYNMRNGELELIAAKATIFATGGAGRMYAKTTNGYASTADGQGVAFKAGIPMMDMEFVQFHPTSLKENGVLLSEAARGEGAYLLNASGERFMFKYAPNKGELASRDVVSRAEWTEILEGRGVDGCVLLDLRHLGREKILERLPQIRELALDATGKDAIDDPIPILPGMHYTMGGIETDKFGATRIPGVYAAGEVACVSVHGANRLGGNSLLETIVFGARAARHATDYAKALGDVRPSQKTLASERERIASWLAKPVGIRAPQLRAAMNKTMSDNVFIFRNEAQLAKAVADLLAIRREFDEGVYVMDKSKTFNTGLISTMETDL